MTLESEFLEMSPETYEETLRVFAGIAAKGARALGEPVPEESQEIFDAPDGSLAAAKRAADSARLRAAQTPVPNARPTELDERSLTIQRAVQEVQEAVSQVLHLNVDDFIVRPQTPDDAIHSFEIWAADGTTANKSGDEDVSFIPFLPPDVPHAARTTDRAPFIVHSLEDGDNLGELVFVYPSSPPGDEHKVWIVDLVDGKYIARKAETDTARAVEGIVQQRSSTAARPTAGS